MICCLCLNQCSKESSSPIFKQDNEYNWVHLIAKYLYIQIKENENCSTLICTGCSKHLKDFHKFWEYIKDRQLIFSPSIQTNEVLTTVKTESIDPFTDYTSLKSEYLSDDENMDNFQTLGQTCDHVEKMDNCQVLNDCEVLNEAIVKDVISRRKSYSTKVSEHVQDSANRNQMTVEERLEEMEKKIDSILNNQNMTTEILTRLSIHDFPANVCFPVNSDDELVRIDINANKEMCKYVEMIKRIIKPDGLISNFNKILGNPIIIAYNYDGVNGKKSFKELKSLNKALFEANSRNGYTMKEYIQEIRTAFRSNKNRIFKNQYDRRRKAIQSINDESNADQRKHQKLET